jgi:hypothetical protein
MNKQIKELVIQADKYANDICDTDANADWYDTRDEKFAQLIVAECAKVILETPVDYMEIDTMHRIRDSVKNHFGVEE